MTRQIVTSNWLVRGSIKDPVEEHHQDRWASDPRSSQDRPRSDHSVWCTSPHPLLLPRPFCSSVALEPCLIPFCCRGRSAAACMHSICSDPIRPNPIRSYWLKKARWRDRQPWLRLRWLGRLGRLGRRWLKLPLEVWGRNRGWEEHNPFRADELCFHLVSPVIRNLIILRLNYQNN